MGNPFEDRQPVTSWTSVLGSCQSHFCQQAHGPTLGQKPCFLRPIFTFVRTPWVQNSILVCPLLRLGFWSLGVWWRDLKNTFRTKNIWFE